MDRILWAWLSHGWHRRGFRLFWTWKSGRRTGRPSVPKDVRILIRELSSQNPLWGAPRISVTDPGGGISPEHLPHVFDRFYKVGAARAAGSAAAASDSPSKAIVEWHGGTVAVTSRPGQTAFVMTLPQAQVVE